LPVDFGRRGPGYECNLSPSAEANGRALDGTVSIADRITVEMPAAREDIDGQPARVTLTAN
jgi:hypothetical protein